MVVSNIVRIFPLVWKRRYYNLFKHLLNFRTIIFEIKMVLGPIDPKFLITNFGLLWQKCGLNKCDPYQADWYPVFEACMNFLVVQLPIMPTAGKWPWIQNKWTISGPVTFYLKVISGDEWQYHLILNRCLMIHSHTGPKPKGASGETQNQ